MGTASRHSLDRFSLKGSPQVQVVAGLIRRRGQVLLCHRRADRSHYPDVWDLPGGRVEPGETLVEAVVRELEEELGISARLPAETAWLTLTNDELRLHIYLVDEWWGEPSNRAVDEHDEIKWISVDEVAEFDLAHGSYVEMLERAFT